MKKSISNNMVYRKSDPEKSRQLALVLMAYRRQHKLSQEQLAQRIGTSVFSVCRWERGKHYPSQSMIKLMKLLGVL